MGAFSLLYLVSDIHVVPNFMAMSCQAAIPFPTSSQNPTSLIPPVSTLDRNRKIAHMPPFANTQGPTCISFQLEILHVNQGPHTNLVPQDFVIGGTGHIPIMEPTAPPPGTDVSSRSTTANIRQIGILAPRHWRGKTPPCART